MVWLRAVSMSHVAWKVFCQVGVRVERLEEAVDSLVICVST